MKMQFVLFVVAYIIAPVSVSLLGMAIDTFMDHFLACSIQNFELKMKSLYF